MTLYGKRIKGEQKSLADFSCHCYSSWLCVMDSSPPWSITDYNFVGGTKIFIMERRHGLVYKLPKKSYLPLSEVFD